MMNVAEAIELLAPFHNAQLVCVIRNTDGTVTGQLSTSCPELPFIAVNHNQVMLDDVLEVIEALANPNQASCFNLFADHDACSAVDMSNIWAA